MQANEAESIDERVRGRLRDLRRARGLTLEQVAAATHINTSTLSRIEAGKRRLSLDLLPSLAAALGVTTDDLLGARAAAEDPRVRREPIQHEGLTLWPLTRRGPADGLQAYKMLISGGRDTPPAELPEHEGHEWLYVLSGHMRLVLGASDFVIEPGEAVEFDTRQPHWFGSARGPAEVISILGPRGERVHLRQ